MNVVDYLFKDSKNINKELILGNSEIISFKESYKQITKISGFLRKEVGENKMIILMSENSVFFIIAYFGIIKSGNICIPVNPTIGHKALTHIIYLCGCELCLTQKRIQNKFNDFKVHIVNDKSVKEIIEKNSLGNTSTIEKNSSEFDHNRSAAIIFTSGSTALPKGVILSHRNIMANTDSILEYLQLTSDDIVELVLPLSYCYGLSLLHTHVKVGGSLVINNSFIFLDTVIEDLIKYKGTGFAGVPSHFQILLRNSSAFKKRSFPNLKYVTQAGGKLHVRFIREFVETFPTVKFYVMYGQTEATARLSYLPPELLMEKMGSIGKGIPNVKLEVLNKESKPVRPGELGEIVATGENVMVGYLGDEELTNQVIKDGKLFTRDMGTIDEDGFIYVVSREEEFLKVGGERISPAEIEEVICNIPEVIDCSIIGVEDDQLGEAIKALIVLKDNNKSDISKENIISFCRKKMSFNKVPKYVEFIDRIPFSSTGKKIRTKI